MPSCFCVPNLVRICQEFLEILSGNPLPYAVALNDLCNLENVVTVTRFEFGLCLPCCFCVPNMVGICQIFLEILSGNYLVALNDLFDLENDVKVTQFELGLRLALVLLCTKFGEDK